MAPIPYVSSDAWLLLSSIVGGAANGATLEDIVSVGDGINHAIFTFNEIDGGLARLVAGGFVAVRRKRVIPTDKAMAIYQKVQKRRGSMLTQMEAVGRKLGAEPWSPGSDPNRADPAWSIGHFSSGDLDRACRRYKRKFAAVLRRIEERRNKNPRAKSDR